jgi:hypothetical protein
MSDKVGRVAENAICCLLTALYRRRRMTLLTALASLIEAAIAADTAIAWSYFASELLATRLRS